MIMTVLAQILTLIGSAASTWVTTTALQVTRQSVGS